MKKIPGTDKYEVTTSSCSVES